MVENAYSSVMKKGHINSVMSWITCGQGQEFLFERVSYKYFLGIIVRKPESILGFLDIIRNAF
ncbi:MAG: hypothetical protein ABR969_04895 [Sedimentisphaerales bacterium]